MRIRSARSEVNNLRTPIPILLEACTLGAVVGVGDARGAADDAAAGVGADCVLIRWMRRTGSVG